MYDTRLEAGSEWELRKYLPNESMNQFMGIEEVAPFLSADQREGLTQTSAFSPCSGAETYVRARGHLARSGVGGGGTKLRCSRRGQPSNSKKVVVISVDTQESLTMRIEFEFLLGWARLYRLHCRVIAEHGGGRER